VTRKGTPLRRPRALALGLLLVLLAGTWAWGQGKAPQAATSGATVQEKGPKKQKPDIPLSISAAQLEADQDQNLIVFKGKVKAVYGDTTLYADQLLVFYKPRKKDRSSSSSAEKSQEISPLGDLGGEKIDRIEARGNVRYVQGDRVATGEKAVYYRDKDEIVLLGQPQVWRGENHLRGSKITFNLASQKVRVESSPQQRVEAHLYQDTRGGKPPRDLFPGGPPAVPPTGRPR
jgi:lipopolysaccharide export system protein LptA